jgi:hypothetical protein
MEIYFLEFCVKMYVYVAQIVDEVFHSLIKRRKCFTKGTKKTTITAVTVVFVTPSGFKPETF